MDDEKRLLTSIKSMDRAAELTKHAKLSVSDVEDDLGIYLSDKDETKVRRLIKERTGKSFAMRHPLLTGIPTLGIAPAVAKANAKEKIIRRLARDDVKLRGEMAAAKDKRRAEALEEYKATTERDKANQASRAAGALGRSGVEIAALLAASKRANMQKESAAKATFSPAMDKSPALKGKQSKLPDKIQAGILKKKMKKKEAAVVRSGLIQASEALYTDLYAKRGLEKRANPFAAMFPSLTRGAGKWAAGGAALGGLGAGARRLSQLRELAASGGRGKWAKDWHKAMAEKSVAAKAGETYTMPGRLAQESQFLKAQKGLKGKAFADAPMEYLKAYGPEVAKAMLEGGGAAALAGGASRMAANWARRKKMMDTAKAVAVPAALGLGGYALLKD